MKMKLIATASLLLLVLTISISRAQAPPDSVDTGKWSQSITLYFWLPAQNGNAVVRGRSTDVDVSLSDSWDALSSLDGAATLHYEAQKNRFYIWADLFYVDLEDSVATPLGNARYESSQTIAELATAYEVGRKNQNTNRLQTVDLVGGFRYSELDLELRGPLGVVDADGDQSWVDPFIGARLTRHLSDEWLFWTRGDIGGFGIGDASDFTWNLVLGFEKRLSGTWGLELGWRWLDYNYDTGSGSDRFEYDVLMQGPFTGFRYSW